MQYFLMACMGHQSVQVLEREQYYIAKTEPAARLFWPRKGSVSPECSLQRLNSKRKLDIRY